MLKFLSEKFKILFEKGLNTLLRSSHEQKRAFFRSHLFIYVTFFKQNYGHYKHINSPACTSLYFIFLLLLQM